ncbi:MAG: sugar phosphate isomerase/epimerase [Gammaproteobacteria bacterium]|jgi:sugar phosphate isomerase/epimerase|nr:sugar phosphate isomerase/epimerase [Gammaproteobacteria bacterium]MBT5683334.1 sugar phosphate isomerase/epimerase [Gammaproteobacteria bacterium]
MKTLKGPGIFLAQFMADDAPFNSIDAMAEWAASLGFVGVQVPIGNANFIDVALAAESQTYCDELVGRVAAHGIEITELSTHLEGQLVAVHPAYDEMFDGFAAPAVRGNPEKRRHWAVEQVKLAARASRRLGLTEHATFSGSLLWPYMYPWAPRPAGLVEEGFAELAKRWLPILNVYADEGVNVCYEIHPGEDLHDGITFERFLDAVDQHASANILYDPSHLALQQMDYLSFIDHYHERIKMFHVKDAELKPNGKSGVYGGFQDWLQRPGRFRSLGDGQIDFKGIFSKFAGYDFDGWAVLEWECCLKHQEVGAREGAEFIRQHIIPVTDKAFDNFAAGELDEKTNRRILGLDN